MPFRVLLSPELQKERRHRGEGGLRAMDLSMASWTQRQHEAKNRLSGHPMMHNDRALIPARSVTDAAAVAISLQDRLTQAAEVLFILPLQREPACTQGQEPAQPALLHARSRPAHGRRFKPSSSLRRTREQSSNRRKGRRTSAPSVDVAREHQLERQPVGSRRHPDANAAFDGD